MTGLTNGNTNGHAHTNGVTHGPTHAYAHGRRELHAGIYAPIPTFFLPGEEQDLDIPAFQAHLLHVASSGVGPLLCGSMGEAHHLLPHERTLLIRTARATLDNAGMEDVPIISGTGAGSLKETLMLTKQAADAGVDAVIVICSGFFAGALANDADALEHFWLSVADKSPVPVIIYNYPGASGGIDLSSTQILSLAKHPNIIGCKLTCGNVGKLTRIAASIHSPRSPRPSHSPFLVLGGFTDFVLPSAFAQAHGAITGLANVAPYACMKLFTLTEQLKSHLTTSSSDPGLYEEVIRLQGIIAEGDRTLAVAGINGTKSVLERMHGWGGDPRRPLPPYGKARAAKLWEDENVKALLVEENRAAKEATANGRI